MIKRVLGHWCLEEEIGKGGMGVVYRARDTHLGRDVAVKVLPPGLLADAAARKRFRQEALFVSRLNHPNIQVVHDFDTEDGVDFLVTEYIPGESLDARILRGPLDEKELLRLGTQLAHGLQAAHEKGLIHRDLKPSNLRVTPQGQLKILDFGLAKLLETSPDVSAPLTTTLELLTQEGAIAGTLPYMSPEQLKGEPLDARTDLFSAGVVLYELATGQRPFAGDNQPILINAILSQTAISPSQVNRKVSGRLDQVILKALEKDRELRYQTARDLAIDLERLTVSTQPVALPARPPSRKRVPIAAGGIVLGGVLMTLFLLCRPLQGEALDSIAVLPFENASGNPDLEYLSDGIAENLTNTLSQLPSLKKVIAWGSMRQIRDQMKDSDLDPAAAGKRLDVRAILLGRVRNHGQDLEVQAELMRVRDSRHVWGDEYRGTVADIVNVENQLAKEITESLRIRLNSKGHGAAKPTTTDPEAYQFYLRGRYCTNNGYLNEAPPALAYFQKAIARDPNFAQAYAGLADALYTVNNVWKPPLEIMPQMKAAALTAIELDPDLADAYATLGMVTFTFEFNWPQAETYFKKSLELNPGWAPAHFYYGLFLVESRRMEEARPYMNRALELDPLSDFVRGYAIYPDLYSGHYDRVIDYLRQWLSSNPVSPFPDQLLGETYEFNGQLRQALTELQHSLDKGPYPWTIAAKARVLVKLGRKSEALQLLNELEMLAKTTYVAPYAVASVYAELGDKNTAFHLLEKAYQERSEDIALLGIDPRLNALKHDPRYVELLKKTGIPIPTS